MSADDELVEQLRDYADDYCEFPDNRALFNNAAAAITRLTAALTTERERCAKVADEFNNEQNGPVAAAISRAIRSLPDEGG